MDSTRKRLAKARLQQIQSGKQSRANAVLQEFRKGETLLLNSLAEEPRDLNAEEEYEETDLYDDDGQERQDPLMMPSQRHATDQLEIDRDGKESLAHRKDSDGGDDDDNDDRDEDQQGVSTLSRGEVSTRSNKGQRDVETENRRKGKEKAKERVMKDTRLPSQKHFATQEDLKDLFFYDTEGDQNTLVYQSLYRADVPPYIRFGKGVLGLNPAFTLRQFGLSRTGHKWLIIPNDDNRRRMPRYCGRTFVKLEKSKSIRRIDLSRNTIQSKIRIGSASTDYLSLETEVQSKHGFTSLLEKADEGEEEEEGETYEVYITRKTKELNQKTREQPKNIDAWIELAKFQEEFLSFHGRLGQGSLFEKQISIYERALMENPESEDLWIAYLKLCSVFLEPTKALKRWEQTVFKNTHMAKLWSAYVAYRCSNFSTFSISSMRTLYGSAIQMIFENSADAAGTSILAGYDMEKFLLSLFIRSCVMEKQAGYPERAIGRFQALIEYICFKPEHMKNQHQLARLFQEFWNSGAPKIGDDGAKGFSNWLADNARIIRDENYQEVEIDETIDHDILEGEVKWGQWLLKEEMLEKAHWKPLCLGGDPKDFDDEDRIVPFDMVQDFLFEVQSESLKVEVILVFLEFLGVPLPSRRSTRDYLSRDRVIERENFDDVVNLLSKPSRTKIDMNAYRTLADSRLVPFVQNVLTMALQAFPKSIAICEAQIGVDGFGDLKKARKSCKSLLKVHRTSLTLWHSYASVEAKHGNFDEAVKIYDTALASVSGFKTQPEDYYLIFWKYAELVLEQGLQTSIQAAIHILSSVVDKQFQPVYLDPKVDFAALTNPTRIIKCKRLYRDAFSGFKSKPSREGMYFFICFMWFEYLTQRELSSALEIATEIANFYVDLKLTTDEKNAMIPTQFKDRLQFDFEMFLVSKIHLLSHSASRAPLAPKVFRQHLAECLLHYPNNVYFLGTYISSQENSNLTAGIRRYFDESSPQNPTPAGWMFSILYELQRNSSPNRIHSLFEKALEDQHCPASVVLWRMYIQWDMSRKTSDTTKRLFYRAIDRCPWSRKLWLECIRTLQHQFRDDEILDLLDLMREKELRIHTDLSIWSTLPLRMPIEDEDMSEDRAKIEDADDV